LTDNGSGSLVATQVTNGADLNSVAGTIDYTTGEWTIDISGFNAANKPNPNSAITATYYYVSEKVAQTSNPNLSSTSYDTSTYGQNVKIPEVNIDIALTTVTAITRKLKARWSSEAVDDLRAFHGLNAETELVAGIANEISLELDREIIQDLVNGAKFGAAYNFTTMVGGIAPAGNTFISGDLGVIRGLMSVIDSVSAQIHKASLRAPANFIVVSPEVGAILNQLASSGEYRAMISQEVDPSYGPMNSNFGVQRIGTLMNRYAVYQDPFLGGPSSGLLPGGAAVTGKPLLIGLKGNSFLDAGYVYAPYIPLQVTPTFLDPDDFTFRKGLQTRYAKKMLRSEYYGIVDVVGFPTVASA
jgi:hypothetical protein